MALEAEAVAVASRLHAAAAVHGVCLTALLVTRGATGPMQLVWRCEEKAAADGSLMEELRITPPSTARAVAAAAEAEAEAEVEAAAGAEVETEAEAEVEAEGEAGGGAPSRGVALRLRLSPRAFFQTSTAGAEVLYGAVAELVERVGGGRGGPPRFPPLLLDVCCGGGAIGLWVAQAAAAVGTSTRVLGIEANQAAAADAAANAAANGLDAAQYSVARGRAEDHIATLEQRLQDVATRDGGAVRGPAAVAVLDPPRTGLSPSVCRALRASDAVGGVVFVSCNPHGHTLRRDFVLRGGNLAANARILCARGPTPPFRLCAAVPVDLFRDTPHCELVLAFERRVERRQKKKRPQQPLASTGGAPVCD